MHSGKRKGSPLLCGTVRSELSAVHCVSHLTLIMSKSKAVPERAAVLQGDVLFALQCLCIISLRSKPETGQAFRGDGRPCLQAPVFFIGTVSRAAISLSSTRLLEHGETTPPLCTGCQRFQCNAVRARARARPCVRARV